MIKVRRNSKFNELMYDGIREQFLKYGCKVIADPPYVKCVKDGIYQTLHLSENQVEYPK